MLICGVIGGDCVGWVSEVGGMVVVVGWWDGVRRVLMTLVSVWPGQGQDKVMVGSQRSGVGRRLVREVLDLGGGGGCSRGLISLPHLTPVIPSVQQRNF